MSKQLSDKEKEDLINKIRYGDPNDKHQIIELDCPPGSPRPNDLLPEVIKDTGLEVRKASSSFFGNWSFDYNDIPEDQWKKTQPILAERITDLYNKGIIRYGSW